VCLPNPRPPRPFRLTLPQIQKFEDLSLLCFSPASLALHLEQAVAVLEVVAASPAAAVTNSPPQKAELLKSPLYRIQNACVVNVPGH